VLRRVATAAEDFILYITMLTEKSSADFLITPIQRPQYGKNVHAIFSPLLIIIIIITTNRKLIIYCYLV
jgi:hypothetical protein